MLSFALVLLVSEKPDTSFARLIQIPPPVSRYEPIRDKVLEEASKLGRGITLSMGYIDAAGVMAQARFPEWRYFDPVIDGALKRGIRKIRLKIGGGPPKHRSWIELNGGKRWNEPYRPPKGPDYAVWNKIVSYKQATIDRAYNKVKKAGLDPKEALEIEIATEPCKGGSDGPWTTAGPFRYQHPFDHTPEGTWDDQIHEQLSYEAQKLDYKGLRVFSPAFEYQSEETFAQELATFKSPKGEAWRKRVDVWVLNLYPNLQGTGKSSLYDAVRSFREKGTKALRVLRGQREIGRDAQIAIGEHGWTLEKLNRSKSDQNEVFRGEVIKACEEAAVQMGFESVSLYALAEDKWGLFDEAMRPKPARTSFSE